MLAIRFAGGTLAYSPTCLCNCQTAKLHNLPLSLVAQAYCGWAAHQATQRLDELHLRQFVARYVSVDELATNHKRNEYYKSKVLLLSHASYLTTVAVIWRKHSATEVSSQFINTLHMRNA